MKDMKDEQLKTGLTINEISQGKLIGTISWASFLTAFIFPITILAPLIIFFYFRDTFSRHPIIYENLSSAYKLFCINIVLWFVTILLFLTVVMAPVAFAISIILSLTNIFYSIRGMIRISKVELTGNNFEYVDRDN